MSVLMLLDHEWSCLPVLDCKYWLLCGVSGFKGELWVSLVEKAYAKLCGGYASLRGRLIVDGMRALTGGIPITLAIKPSPTPSGHAPLPTADWASLLERVAEGAPTLLYRSLPVTSYPQSEVRACERSLIMATVQCLQGSTQPSSWPLHSHR